MIISSSISCASSSKSSHGVVVFSAGFLSTSMPCTAAIAEAGSVLPLINWFIDSGSPMVAES